MRHDGTVAPECRKQSVRTDAAVGEQPQPAAPVGRDLACGQFLSTQKVRDARRQQRTHERQADDQHGLAREPVRQMVPRVEDAVSGDGQIADADRDAAQMRARRPRAERLCGEPDAQKDRERRSEQKRDADV